MEKEVKKSEKKALRAKKVAPKTDSSNIYELSYILLPNISDTQISEEVSSINTLVSKNGGEMISSENPVLIDLAYPMLKVVSTTRHKVNQGYFGWMKFEMESENINVVKKALDLNNTVVRFMIIKTVRENTLLNGKMIFKKEDKMRKIDEGEDSLSTDEVVAPMNPEEVDKSIDDLVIA